MGPFSVLATEKDVIAGSAGAEVTVSAPVETIVAAWGINGQVRLDFGTGEDEPHDIEVDGQGRILVGGSVYESQVVARLRDS